MTQLLDQPPGLTPEAFDRLTLEALDVWEAEAERGRARADRAWRRTYDTEALQLRNAWQGMTQLLDLKRAEIEGRI